VEKALIIRSIIVSLSCLVFPAICFNSDDYAAWAIRSKSGSWTKLTESAVKKTNLPTAKPHDVSRFCPRYKKLGRPGRVKFWVALVSAVADAESSFEPKATSRPIFSPYRMTPAISRGLLQLDKESAGHKKYKCSIVDDIALYNPVTNLTCGVKILAIWVDTDNAISTYRDDRKPQGGGKYWGTLRQSNRSFRNILSYTRELQFCRKQA
jgi:soluble lytic murein transglycosylase-like protein